MHTRYLALLMLSLLLLQACAQQPLTTSRSNYHSIFSPSLNKPMPYSVYTPLGWSTQERLPLVVLLHGISDDHQTFDRYQVGEHLDQLMLSKDLPRAIVVVPKGERGFWENWDDGSKNYRDWVLQDVMADLSLRYPHAPCPENCHLMGISMGGHGVFSIMAAEPERFVSATIISGRLFTKGMATQRPVMKIIVRLLLPLERIWGDKKEGRIKAEMQYQRWLSDPVLAKKSLLIAWGNKENKNIINFNERFHAELVENQTPHDVIVYDGGHKWLDWKAVIAESMRRQLRP